MLKKCKEVAICYTMKEEMVRLYELRDEEQSIQGWRDWIAVTKAGGIPALIRFAEIKERYLPGLIVHAASPISTGELAGFNNVIKTARRTAYDYLIKDFFLRLI